MDYEGQKLAEILFYWIILVFGAVGWVIGYFQEDFTVVFQAWLAGVVLSVIVSQQANEIPFEVETLSNCMMYPFVFQALCTRLALLQ